MNTTATIVLDRINRNCRERFKLCLDAARAILVDAAGRPVAVFDHENAEERITLLNEWIEGALAPLVQHFQSRATRKYKSTTSGLAIRADNSVVYYFIPTRDVQRQVQAYLDTALSIQGSKRIQGLQRKGLWILLSGVALVAISPCPLIVLAMGAAGIGGAVGIGGHEFFLVLLGFAILFHVGVGLVAGGARSIRRARHAQWLRATLHEGEVFADCPPF